MGGYVALQFGDLGHSRGSNKVNTNQTFNDQGAALHPGTLTFGSAAPAVYTMSSGGFTLLGLPTITATVNTLSTFGEITGRLWDVLPNGSQRLVSRGVYRLTDNQSGPVTFQLHGNGTSSRPATPSSWSSWAATRRTTGPATARSRSRSRS